MPADNKMMQQERRYRSFFEELEATLGEQEEETRIEDIPLLPVMMPKQIQPAVNRLPIPRLDKYEDPDLHRMYQMDQIGQVLHFKENYHRMEQEKRMEQERLRQQEKAEQERLRELQRQQEAEQERLRQQQAEKQEKRKKQTFVDQSVLETTADFQILTEEQRNALSKTKRNAYDKKKEEWDKNVQQQRAVAEAMFHLKEEADALYKKLDFSKHPMDAPFQRELNREFVPAEEFAPEVNMTLISGKSEIYCRNMKRLYEQNKKDMEQLEMFNRQYFLLQEELQKLKEKQGFPVPKKKTPHADDFLGNLDKINHYLRVGEEAGEKVSPALSVAANVTAVNLTKNAIGKQMVVHRSLTQQEWEEMRGAKLPEKYLTHGADAKYKVFTDKGFCKASLGEEDTDEIQLVIAVDQSVAAMRVSGAAQGGKDGIILPRDTKYYIVKEEKYFAGGKEKTRVFLSVGTS